MINLNFIRIFGALSINKELDIIVGILINF